LVAGLNEEILPDFGAWNAQIIVVGNELIYRKDCEEREAL
jgi:hypothetical protein